MNNPAKATFGRCTITGADKLPLIPGGNEAVCRKVETAINARTQTRDYHVEVKVVSQSRLSAVVVVKGHPLPEQRFAVMDGVINPGSIDRFADSLAGVIARTVNR